MAIRQIRLNGDEILRKKSREVDVVDEKIKELLQDMVETMHKYNGVGLAAPQVGVLKRAIVIDLYDGNEPLMLVNPRIIKTKGTQEVEEGCLSFPNQFAKIIRRSNSRSTKSRWKKSKNSWKRTFGTSISTRNRSPRRNTICRQYASRHTSICRTRRKRRIIYYIILCINLLINKFILNFIEKYKE